MDSLQNYTCSICLGLLSNPLTTKCNHHFCQTCIEEFSDFQEDLKCPNCRSKIGSVQSLNLNNQLQEYIVKNFPQEWAKRLKELVEINRIQDFMMKIVIEYGNTHQTISNQEPRRNHTNSEQWCCFVKLRGLEGKENDYISHVEFKLHETFADPLVKVKTSPYQVKKIGWGTFAIPIKIYWKKWLSIPQPTELVWDLDFYHRKYFHIHTMKVDKRNMGQMPKPIVPPIRN